MIFDFLKPGIYIKRWILLMVICVLLVSASLSKYIDVFKFTLELQFPIRIILFIIGILLFLVSLMGLMKGFIRLLNKSLPFRISQKTIFDAIYSKGFLEKGPRIVAIGGGTGLSTMLRGIKNLTANITAIVTVADDGGGSGKLREDLGMLPPGDIRNCILALANTEEIMQNLLNYRFKEGSLKGQSFGNLFLAAMTGIAGNFEKAVKLMSEVLAVRGKVLPVTLDNVNLCAELEDGSVVVGESKIPEVVKEKRGKIKRVFIVPQDAKPYREVLEEIEKADVIIIGPGSLYTSIMPNLVFDEVVESIKKSKAKKIYIANIMTQPGETDNYTLYDHIRAIENHCKGRIFDIVIVNNQPIPPDILKRYEEDGAKPVYADKKTKESGYTLIEEALLSISNGLIRHNSAKLARVISNIIYGKNVIHEYKLGYLKLKSFSKPFRG
ncbi:gluconeogenesis factor YvcK family protein [Caldicellulosiruptor naganoensis]|uniref:Putative gluconeogenesis factor n=1 Tax=Caldicellulosiruptor naganoensis TaxID=29324 RepID=A0ABY7BLT8_9FIRM|nr:YvcK family protein [Caldicellulosiruptor naganoensis]WAM31996.1 YvcK family protein [Caldicellulosiruptor naganoensis]